MRRALSVALTGVCFAMAVPVVFAQAPYSSPRTPWGNPDLQAIWSGDSAFGIPLQRPAALGIKAELTDQELAEKVRRDDRTRTTGENAVGSFRNATQRAVGRLRASGFRLQVQGFGPKDL